MKEKVERALDAICLLELTSEEKSKLIALLEEDVLTDEPMKQTMRFIGQMVTAKGLSYDDHQKLYAFLKETQ